MLFFADDPDNRPPSILLTTLAARAYRGENDLFTAGRNVLAAMPHFIEKHNGQCRVPNPAHEDENFVDDGVIPHSKHHEMGHGDGGAATAATMGMAAARRDPHGAGGFRAAR